MMFSAADGMGKSETVHLNKGRTIYYPDYLGNYLTCLFTVNGKLAYCLESHRASPPTGDYVADILESNKNLQKVLYYGYGGAGDITGSYLSGKSDDESMFIPILQHLMPIVGIWHLQDARMKTWSMQV